MPRDKIRLVSSAGTGHFYTTDKNKRTMPEKFEMKECNEQRNLCKASPSETTVQKWNDAAKDLEAELTY